jgi:hypothetical protein
MKKLKDLMREAMNPQLGKVYSDPYSTSFVKENEESTDGEFTSEQRDAFLEAVKQYKKYGESVYRKKGLTEVCESIKGLVEVANRVTIKETGDWFDGVTVSRHLKRMNESYKVFAKTLTEVDTLQQRMESSYDEIGEVLGKYYEIYNGDDSEIEEGNEFGAARAKAIAAGSDSFEVDGKTYPLKGVDKDDKENAKEFTKESMKLTDMVSVNEGSISIDKKVTNIINSRDFKKFVNYFNSFYGKNGIYSSGKDIAEKDIMKGLYNVFKRNNSYEWGDGDSVDRELVRDELFKMKVLSDKIYKNEALSVNEAGDFAGWIAIFNGKKLEIDKSQAKDLYNAKLFAIKTLKVPKSKVGMLAIKPAVSEAVVNEAKYDIGMARKGNGITVYNRAEEEAGDYKNVAHISDNGVVKYYDKKLPSNIKKQIEAEAKKMMEITNEGNTMIKLKNLMNESFGFGELPSDKLMKMKVSAKEMLDSVNPKKMKESVVTEAVKEVVLSNRILNFLEERGVIKASDSQKIHKDLTAFLKKNLNESVVTEGKVIVYNEKTGERYEVLSGSGKGDLLIAMNALQKAAPAHMKYSIK